MSSKHQKQTQKLLFWAESKRNASFVLAHGGRRYILFQGSRILVQNTIQLADETLTRLELII